MANKTLGRRVDELDDQMAFTLSALIEVQSQALRRAKWQFFVNLMILVNLAVLVVRSW